jgi:LmbE family N-acetylglucosaminyl deacetylase
MKSIVIAPHPDDETLGVGGTLIRRKSEGDSIAWVIATKITAETGWSSELVQQREREIQQITAFYQFDEVYELGFPATQLDSVPARDLINALSDVFKEYEPGEVFVPHPADVHSDHRVVFEAVVPCTKWFRYPSVKRVLAYETLSETDFGLDPNSIFRPNFFVDIEKFLDSKLEAMSIYESELGDFPFPRSHEAIRALAALRGSASGFKAAEAFELLRERY